MAVWATTTARRLARIKRPIAIASCTEPPAELMRIGRRRSPTAATTRASASAVPMTILPSADIHSGQSGWQAEPSLLTRTNRIGAWEIGAA